MFLSRDNASLNFITLFEPYSPCLVIRSIPPSLRHRAHLFVTAFVRLRFVTFGLYCNYRGHARSPSDWMPVAAGLCTNGHPLLLCPFGSACGGIWPPGITVRAALLALDIAA